MLNTVRRVSRLSDLQPFPASVLSFDGQLVDTSQTVWRFRSPLDGGTTITIHWARQDELSVLIKSTCAALGKALFRRPDRAEKGEDHRKRFSYVPAPARVAALAHSATGRVDEPNRGACTRISAAWRRAYR